MSQLPPGDYQADIVMDPDDPTNVHKMRVSVVEPAPAPRERKFLVVAAVDLNEDSWNQNYGGDLITPQNVAQWLTFQFIGGVQQGVEVFTVVEIPEGVELGTPHLACNNG